MGGIEGLRNAHKTDACSCLLQPTQAHKTNTVYSSAGGGGQ